MKQLSKILSALCLTFFMLACVGPEKFDLLITVKKNGDYSYLYKGTVFYVPGVLAFKEGKKSKEVLDTELKGMEKEFLKDKRYKSAKYISNGRYQVEIQESGNVKKTDVSIMDKIVTIRVNKKSSQVEIRGTTLTAKSISDLASLDIKIDGQVKVETDAEIVSSNVDKSFLSSGYKWVFKKPSDTPINMNLKIQ